ncbi:MAG: hypothetical protein IH946_03160, partial [Bacteroidetes bacterium]|nr:hypothetical protein [Bacteroidota bacterium]
TGNFVKVESDKFFNSIEFHTVNITEYKTYSPNIGGFEVQMPANFVEGESFANGRIKMHNPVVQAYDKSNNEYFKLMKATLHDLEYIEEDSFELKKLLKEYAENMSLDVDIKEFGNHNGYPSISAMLKRDSKILNVKIVIKGADYYLLAAKTNDIKNAEKFFASFKFSEYHYRGEAKVHEDTTMYFTVKSHARPETSNLMRSMMSGFGASLTDEDKEDLSYQGEDRDLDFTYSPTNETIKVIYTTYHKYKIMDDWDEFWDDAIDDLTKEDEDLYVRSKKLKEEDNQQFLDVILGDSSSSRQIDVRFIQKDGAIFAIISQSDTLSGPSPLARSFRESFEIMDTTIGNELTGNKIDLLFKDLYSKDSITKAHALSSIYYLKYEDSDAPRIIKAINDFNTKQDGLWNKAELIRELGYLQHKDIVPYLKKFYYKANDTVTFQISILEALAYQKTPLAYKTILELIKHNIPLTSDEEEIDYIFSPFYDSLEVAITLFPKLLNFTHYPEYKDNIYALMATLADSSLLKPAIYRSYLKEITREANDDWKRKLIEEENADNEDYYSYYGNYTLENYLSILVLNYKDENVHALFKKIGSTKDDNLLLNYAILLLQNGIEPADSIWER